MTRFLIQELHIRVNGTISYTGTDYAFGVDCVHALETHCCERYAGYDSITSFVSNDVFAITCDDITSLYSVVPHKGFRDW